MGLFDLFKKKRKKPLNHGLTIQSLSIMLNQMNI